MIFYRSWDAFRRKTRSRPLEQLDGADTRTSCLMQESVVIAMNFTSGFTFLHIMRLRGLAGNDPQCHRADANERWNHATFPSSSGIGNARASRTPARIKHNHNEKTFVLYLQQPARSASRSKIPGIICYGTW